MSHYDTRFKTIAALSDTERQTLADLYLRHYDACDEARFYADLDAKSDQKRLNRHCFVPSPACGRGLGRG